MKRSLATVPIAVSLLFLLRIPLVATLGTGRDEAAYWYAAWHAPAASFAPVASYAIRASTGFLGDTCWAIRLPFLLAGALSIVAAVVAARDLGAKRDETGWAAAALATSPWLGYVGTLAHPDAFLLLFTLLMAAAAARLVRGGSATRSLLEIAVFASLAALSKPSGVVMLLAAMVLVLRFRQRATRAGLLAALLLGATAVWRMGSLEPRAQSGMLEFGTFSAGTSAVERAGFISGEILLFGGPALLLLGLGGAAALRHRHQRGGWPAWIAGAALLTAFAAAAMTGRAKGNWFLPGLTIFLPLGAVTLRGSMRRLMPAAVGAGAALSVLLAFALWLPAQRGLWERTKHLTALQPIGALYGARIGERERRVSPTRTTWQRLEEYHQDPARDARVTAALADGVRVLASDDYGLAFSIARVSGRSLCVALPWDPLFAGACSFESLWHRGELRPGDDVLVVLSGAGRHEDTLRPWFRHVEWVDPERAQHAAAPSPFRVLRCGGFQLPPHEITGRAVRSLSCQQPSRESRSGRRDGRRARRHGREAPIRWTDVRPRPRGAVGEAGSRALHAAARERDRSTPLRVERETPRPWKDRDPTVLARAWPAASRRDHRRWRT